MSLLSSPDIRLRALEPEDLDALYRWENNTDLWSVGSTLAPFSKYLLKQYISESHRNIYDICQIRFMIEKNDDHQPIGLSDLFDFDPHNSRAAIGIFVDIPYQHRGFATQALSLMEKYAFEFLKIHQLYVHVPEDNIASLSLFRKFGYSEQGMLRDWITADDGYKNVLLFQKINSGKDL